MSTAEELQEKLNRYKERLGQQQEANTKVFEETDIKLTELRTKGFTQEEFDEVTEDFHEQIKKNLEILKNTF